MDTHAGDGGLHSFHDSVTGVTVFDGNSIAYEYDYLQRQSRKTVAGKLKETYAYAPGSGDNTTTTRVSTKRNFWNGSLINQFQHGYDSLGNITSIYDAKTLQRVNYTYDDQGQLLTATHIDNGTVTKTERYTYDNVGNILTFSNGTTSHTYTYGNSDWKDLLTAVDGNAITYDASGNPTSYYNDYTMTWVEGRKLDTVTVNGQTYTYVYNADGQRVKKIHPDGSYIEYYVMDGTTVGESHFTATGNKTLGIRYTLDENGTVVGFTMNGVNYYFAKNLQGDVLAVYNATTNELAAQYTYDSWGNILTATGTLAEINPFRYRGYYYDKETNFYYISSRYYDPEIGRFVNADVFPSTGQGIIGTNMFAYCGNNPVNRVDIGGYFWDTVFDVLSLVSSVAEVVSNPTDVGAWLGLAGDVIDVAVPMVGGVGESVRAVNSARKVADTVDTVHDAGKVLDGAADAGKMLDRADDLTDAAKRADGFLVEGLCFVAGTQVQVEEGTVAIEEIEVGDQVWAWDEETGDVALKTVVETYVNKTDELIHVFVNGEEIVTTPAHPFYSPVKGWTDAVCLRAGDILVLVNGEYVVVEWVQHEILESPVEVYNFQVADYHTYYVSDAGVLVHNTCRNPYGRKGGLAHQNRIKEIGENLECQGYTVTYEYKVDIQGGNKSYRYIDIYATDGTNEIAVQVGRNTQRGIPVARERRALQDLESAGYYAFFIPYN